ncbi:PadR family transcriptional regulator [Streptomyces sp. NPDC058613]|uniref:PadR family transcriptional regulator n=1 Tax=unclassified Streptomyces TaxID=2593676 RepID=UPI00365D38B6
MCSPKATGTATHWCRNWPPGGFGTVRGGALYPVPGRLEADGTVKARWEPGEGGPGRKVHRLTDAGRARPRQETVGWSRFSGAMARLLSPGVEETRGGAP